MATKRLRAQYLCNCASCKGSKYLAYSTTRLHLNTELPLFTSPWQQWKFWRSELTEIEQCDLDAEDHKFDNNNTTDDNYTDNINFNDGYVYDYNDDDDEDVEANDDDIEAVGEDNEVGSSNNYEVDYEADDSFANNVSYIYNEENDDDDVDANDEDDGSVEDHVTRDMDSQMESSSLGYLKSILKLILVTFFNIIHHFRISNNAASAILSLILFILGLLSHPICLIFPKSFSAAVQASQVDTITKHQFIVCPNNSCCKLYNNSDSRTHCNNNIFGKVCGKSLGYEIQCAHGRRKWKPHKKFHFYPPSAWLKKFFTSETFMEMIIKSTPNTHADCISDVSNGRIWKKFADSGFFRSKYNVGLMLNTDWFKPFKRSEYKVAALTLSILNLPREERFKKKWTILAGIIPGPSEPPGNINTFLQPLVDDLNALWNGIPLSCSSPDVNIRAALMIVTADMPALRKLTQFLGHKADLGCSRCKFRAQREPGTSGASGRMCYFTPSSGCPCREHDEVVRQAEEYTAATTKSSAAAIAKKNGVRSSELLRLSYFDIVRMTTTDPMHTFLLGMVRKETELNLRQLSIAQKEEFVRRVKSMRIPYDMGRLPTNIFDDEQYPHGITAAQWKLYIIVYARPCLYNLIPIGQYKCMLMLSKIVAFISSPAFTQDQIGTLKFLLEQHHSLFARVYGKWNVTVNYHMSLHMPDIILDLGPPHAYWCFSYERFNGMLAGSPNSNRNVETEVANRFVQRVSFRNVELPSSDILQAPKNLQSFISSRDDEDYHVPCPLFYLVLMRLNKFEDKFDALMQLDRGYVEDWPLEFKFPCKRNVKVVASFYKELEIFCKSLYGDKLNYIEPRIDKFGRCVTNGIQFSSNFNSTDRGNTVQCVFVDTTNTFYFFYGVVKFFFTVTAVIQRQKRVHHLAYVSWLRFRSYKDEHYVKLPGVIVNQDYKNDRIVSPRRFLSRSVLMQPKLDVPFALVSNLENR